MKENIKEYGIITIGVLLISIAIEYFFAPNCIAAGGVSGLAVVVTHYIPSLSVGSFSFIVNLFLFVLAFIVVGGDFGLKTIYASFGLSFILWFMDKFIHPQALTNDLMLATILGTIIVAIGLSIVFNINASTGGTDILAKILNKYTTFNIGIDKGFYALLSVVINGPLIDKILSIMNQKKQITIISNKNEEISKFIMDELKRGCTALAGSGAYSKEKKEIIYSILNKKELEKLKDFIEKIDNEAFFTIGHIEEVQGKGFLKGSGL